MDVLFLTPPALNSSMSYAQRKKAVIDAIQYANEALARSLSQTTLRAVGLVEMNVTDTASIDDAYWAIYDGGAFASTVNQLRSQYGADFVQYWTASPGNGTLGLGELTGWRTVIQPVESSSFSGISHVATHEFGHNFGCYHDREQEGTPSGGGSAFGYCFTGTDDGQPYSSIMGYCFNSGPTVAPVFSNPSVRWAGAPTGVSIGLSNAADNGSHIRGASASAASMMSATSPVPVLSDDAYTADEDSPLRRLTPIEGVGGNDLPFPLSTAVVESNPTRGTLDLRSDGTFIYTPTPTETGDDSFTYRVGSQTATVRLTIRDVDVPPFEQEPPVLSPEPSFVGEEVMGTSSIVDSDSTVRTFWSVTGGATVAGDDVTLTFAAPGNHPVKCYVIDQVSGATTYEKTLTHGVAGAFQLKSLKMKGDLRVAHKDVVSFSGIARMDSRKTPYSSLVSFAGTDVIAPLIGGRYSGPNGKVRVIRAFEGYKVVAKLKGALDPDWRLEGVPDTDGVHEIVPRVLARVEQVATGVRPRVRFTVKDGKGVGVLIRQ